MFKVGDWVVPKEDVQFGVEVQTKDTVYVIEEGELEFYNNNSDKYEKVEL